MILRCCCLLLVAFPLHPAPADDRPPNPDNLELVKQIHAFIVKTSTESDAGQMKAYTGTISRAENAPYQMAPIPGGVFLMGSPPEEKDRKPDEGPQVKVKIDPFWMGAYEVTWDQCLPFVLTEHARWKDGAKKKPKPEEEAVDAVSAPTSPYTDPTFGMGEKGYPAICLTEHTALKFCQWLSAQTGHCYRLPTEAEWEYAARAGTTTRWFFGDDEKLLDGYAWHYDNSQVENIEVSHPVGQKKPNPWGLYDIYGNASEWTLDQYDAGRYAKLATQEDRTNPFLSPAVRYPRVIRGGSWDAEPKHCRSASRRYSRREFKIQDPQLPQSLWYHTSVQWLGFRIVRPLKLPSAEEMHRIWNLGMVGEDR